MDLFAARITTTIASLRAQLPGRIAAFNALGGVQIVAPADDGNALKPRRPGLGYVFGGMPRHSGGEFPVVEVAVPDAQISQLALGQVAGDLDSTIVVSVWAGRTSGEDFPELYEKVLGYSECVTEVLLQPAAIFASETVDRIRFAFAANPDRRDREEMETFTFGGFHFVTTQGVAVRP